MLFKEFVVNKRLMLLLGALLAMPAYAADVPKPVDGPPRGTPDGLPVRSGEMSATAHGTA